MLLVAFMATILLLSAIAVAPNVRIENQREKEQEMVWRGRQYVRGIKLYYRKMGHFPTSLENLTKPQVGSIRFMRQAYKDPMNTGDGSWRLIYVGPAGQLIGSLKPPETLQLPGVAGAAPAGTPANAGANGSSFGQSSFGRSSSAQSSFGQSSFGQSSFGQSSSGGFGQAAAQNGTQGGSSPSGTTGSAQGANGAAFDGTTVPDTGSSSDSALMGGNIIGVGSKVNKRSLMVYEKAKNYKLFEFVWNPSKDMMNAVQQATTPAPNNNGQGSGFGNSSFGNSGFRNSSQQPANTPTAQPSSPSQPPQP